MTRRISILLPVLFAISITTYALQRDAAISQYVHDNWDTGGGLPSDTIRAVIQTADAFFWLATPAGLTRFSANRFKTLDHRNTKEFVVDNMTALLQTRDGSLWIGTDGGGLIQYASGKFRLFSLDDGLSDHTITALVQDRAGTIWIGTPTGLNRYENGQFHSVQTGPVHSLILDSDSVLAGTENGFFVVHQNGEVKRFPGGAITAFHRTSKGVVYAGVRGQGLMVLEKDQLHLLMAANEVHAILEDSGGNLWVGTDLGLVRSPDGAFTHPEIHAPVTGLMEDREKSVWIATAGDGLHRLRPTAFLTIDGNEELEPQRSWCVYQSKDGAIWIGTDGGVSRWQNLMITNYSTPGPVKSIGEDSRGNIYAATPSGLFRWNQNGFSLAFPNIGPGPILGDPNGGLWIGAKDGLRNLRDEILSAPVGEEITALHQNQKELWVGTKSGLKKWNNGLLEDFLISDEVLCIQNDNSGNLWVATIAGLQRIHKESSTSFTTASGLYDDRIYAILPDQQGYLWMSSPRGVFRAQFKNEAFACISFSVGEGMKSMDCGNGFPGAWKSTNGKFWFPTSQGVSAVDPLHFFVNLVPAGAIIDNVIVDRIPIPDFEKTALNFPKGTSRVEIRYTALSFLPPVRFRYVLEGFDRQWTNAGSQKNALFTNLPPGKYRFKVLACNNSGIWSTTAAILPFEIEGSALPVRVPSYAMPAVTALVGLVVGWLLRRKKK